MMQKQIDGAVKAGGNAWMRMLTDENIDYIIATGFDHAEEIKALYYGEKAAKEEEAALPGNTVHLERLEQFKHTPRNPEGEFFRATAGKAPLVGKDKWIENMRNVPLVYAKAVQANTALWAPGKGKDLPGAFVFAASGAHAYDIEWLIRVAEALAEMKKAGSAPQDAAELVKALITNKRYFCYKIGASISEGADAWCATYDIGSQADLPNSHLPKDGILPFLLTEPPQHDKFIKFTMIPQSFYL